MLEKIWLNTYLDNMITIIMDRSDPTVAEMISGWKEGGSYRAEINNMIQGPTNGNLVHFTADEVLDYGDSTDGESEDALIQEEGRGMVRDRPVETPI